MKDHVSPFFLVVRSNYVYFTIERCVGMEQIIKMEPLEWRNSGYLI